MRRLALALLALGLLLYGAASVVLCENATHLYPNQRRLAPAGLHPEVSIRAADGVELRAWLLEPDDWNGSTVIALHGVADSRNGVRHQAELLQAHGFRVIAPDSRGHGQSGGERFTFGLLEVDDLRRWSDFARSKAPSTRLYGLGVSMGAGILLQASGRGSAFSAVVAESPFATFHDVAVHRVGQRVPFGALPLTEGAFLYARLRYGLDFRQASPLARIAESGPPVLLIHGLEDTNIPPIHSRRLHDAAPTRSTLWLVPAGHHTDTISVDPSEYERRVLAFFSR